MAGNNYGLNNSLEYLEFSLDSFDADASGDGIALTSDWPVFWLGRPLNDIAAIKILECQVPFSYYVFNSSNNTFFLHELTIGGTAYPVTIAPGNYGISDFETAMGAALTAASHNAITYVVTYNTLTYKFTYTSQPSGSIQWYIVMGTAGDHGNTSIRNEIGLFGGVNASTSSGVLVSPYAAQLEGANYLYLNSMEFGSLVGMYLPQGATSIGKGTTGPQVCKVVVNSVPGGVIT